MENLELCRPPGLARAVASRLSEAILAGDFPPGERLIETALAGRLGVSRASLREAFRILAAEGLVQIRPSRGAYVASPSDREIEELSVFRGVIEGTAARLVASRREARSFDRLAELLRQQRDSIAHGNGDFLRSHWDFHRAICEESGNTYILQAIMATSNFIRLYHRIRSPIEAHLVRNNELFFSCIQRGPPEEAEALLRSQIIWAAYEALAKPIPAEIAGYVTCYIGGDGKVQRLLHQHHTRVLT